MKEDRWYYILGKFLKEYARTIVMFLIFCVIFSGVFYLYSLELEAVGYAILLCVCFSIVILAINYYHYLEDYRERQRVLHSIEINFEHLPEPHSLAEEDYQKMIYQLGMINNGHLTDWKQSDSESVDFIQLGYIRLKPLFQ